MELDALRQRIESLDKKLKPIANTPVAFPPDLAGRRMPKDDDANGALVDAVDLYARSDPADRAKIREIFRTNPAFAWAATLPFPPDSEERFRKHLMHFSIIDQGRDWRDALMWLHDLSQSPYATREVVRGVAAMSGDWARDQMLRTISS
ncbi:MAG: hypothetical protein M3041_09320 [Acidobacteriota bacterium]|nr:hypothetical protein [Acidobacteriota bacterium]